jgi:hypothetical protein
LSLVYYLRKLLRLVKRTLETRESATIIRRLVKKKKKKKKKKIPRRGIR